MLEPEVASQVISGLFGNSKVLNKENIGEILKFGEIIMPDEDISRVFAEKYLTEKEVIFEKVFLRWDKLISLKEQEISPDRKISSEDFDKEFIGEAFKESEKSSDWWRQIGAVVVKEGKIIITGYNKHLPSNFSPYINGDPRNNFDAGIRIDLCTSIHAEAATIAAAAKNGINLNGCSIYVTTFPCPTCARLLAESGISKVFYSKGYSLLDAEDILKGYGAEIILVK
jgi:dCMP deaminase